MNAKLSFLGKNAKIALNEYLIEMFCHLFFCLWHFQNNINL